MTKLKQELYNQCAQFVLNKRNTIQRIIDEIHTSMTSESKSTAGDKHETGRAMLQLEREKAGNQLKEVERLEATLKKLQWDKSMELISLGSYVVTDTMRYYISISAGELLVDGTTVYAISMQSPIGQLLLGKKKGDHFVFRGKSTEIVEVS
ncbi:GreA/GreB family elongation factor [Aquimarina agarivorans]|uniref:GreA/GreB family elongation factor n=1 Tax=Aquimarina agarivorans TaxID=980584 RepID=UPI000248FCE3|nr:GreA/GreB family elongation factor [Aquimarina agarivorans]